MAEIIDIQHPTALGYLPHYAPQKRSIKNILFDIRDRETINLIISHQTSRKKLANTRVGNPLTVPNLSKFPYSSKYSLAREMAMLLNSHHHPHEIAHFTVPSM